jgi:hypothetical protein
MAASLPLVLTAVSTAVKVIGAIRQGKSESRAAEYNAAIAERNATIARQQASQQAAQVARENRMRIGTLRANVGAAGITMEGSPIDVLGDVVSQGELERQNEIYRGEIRALGFEDTASLERMRGSSAKSAGYLRAGTALLSGAAQGYGQYEDIYGGGDEEGKPEKLRRLG